MSKVITLLTIFSLILSSCSTFKRDPRQGVTITSMPQGAQIIIDGQYCGETPFTYILSSKRSHLISLEKEGYVPQSYLLNSKMSLARLSSNLLYPIGGLLVGVGLGCVLTIGSSGAGCEPIGTICTMLGAISGIVIGAAGISYNLCTGNARRLVSTDVFFKLQPIPLQSPDYQKNN